MSGCARIARGHRLVGGGLLLRRLSVPAALLAFTALVLAGFTPAGSDVGAGWVLAAPMLLLLGTRLAAVGLAAMGWMTFPDEHRAVLSEAAARSTSGG